LRDEIGTERASELLRAAVREYAENLGRTISSTNEGTSLDKLRSAIPVFAAGDVYDMEPLSDNDKELSLNIRRCKYAEYFQSIGEPEFGALITCDIDPPMTRGIGSDLSLERTQTIMRGGPHCDFRWKLD
jgi:hypothetical protein